jgi:hypothetical protein
VGEEEDRAGRKRVFAFFLFYREAARLLNYLTSPNVLVR